MQRYFIVQILSKLPSINIESGSYNKISYWYLKSWVHAQLFSRLPVKCLNIVVVVSNSNHCVEHWCNQHDGWKDSHFWNIIEVLWEIEGWQTKHTTEKLKSSHKKMNSPLPMIWNITSHLFLQQLSSARDRVLIFLAVVFLSVSWHKKTFNN